MTDNKIKKVSYYLLPSLVSAIVPIITLPIFSRKLTVEQYGVYALCVAFGTFISGLANMGLTTGYERNYFEQKNNELHGKLLYSVVLFVTATCFIFGGGIFLFKRNISYWISGSYEYGTSFILGYFAVSISTIKQYFLLYLKNTGNAKSFAWFSIDEVILNMLLSIFLVLYVEMGIDGLLLGQFIGALSVTILLIFRLKKILPFGLSKMLMRNCFAISLPLTPRIFFGVIGTQFDKYLISLLGTLGGVGLYNLGQKIAYVVFNYMTALQNVYSPTVYKMMFEKGDDANGKIGKYLTLPFFFSALGGLVLALFSEEIIIILTPSSYHNAIDIVSILSLMYVLFFFGKQPQLVYAKKTSIISTLSLISILINILINIPLVKMFGGVGAAYGSLISAFISGLIILFVSQKYFSIMWEWKKIIFCLITIFSFTFLNILFRSIGYEWELRIFYKLIAILIYLLGGFYFSIITKVMIFSKMSFKSAK